MPPYTRNSFDVCPISSPDQLVFAPDQEARSKSMAAASSCPAEASHLNRARSAPASSAGPPGAGAIRPAILPGRAPRERIAPNSIIAQSARPDGATQSSTCRRDGQARLHLRRLLVLPISTSGSPELIILSLNGTRSRFRPVSDRRRVQTLQYTFDSALSGGEWTQTG